MDSLVSLLSQPIVIGFVAVVIIAAGLHRISKNRRTREWIVAANRLGLTYMDEDGKLRGERAQGTATESDVDFVKQFRFRCLSGGYHQHVLIGKQRGLPILIADYQESREPETLLANNRTSQAADTFTRTVFAGRKRGATFPRMLICRDSFLAEQLKWTAGEKAVEFDDDPEFSRCFHVFSSEPDKARKILGAKVRALLSESESSDFHLETAGDRLAIHLGKRLPPAEAEPMVEHLCAIARAI